MHNEDDPSDTARILDRQPVYLRKRTLFVRLSNICVVSEGLILLRINYSYGI